MLRIPLDLPDVRTLGMSTTPHGEFIIKVESTLKGTTCRQCGRHIEAGYGRDRPLRLRHLSILDRPVYIEIRPKRYRCLYCDDHPTTTQRLAWYEPNSPHTKAYEKTVLRELINSTVADVSRKQEVTEDEVLGIIDRHIAREVDWARFERLEVVGLDEIAIRKGQHEYVVIVSHRDAQGQVDILGVLPDRTKATVKGFLEGIPERLRSTVERVCTDMYEGFANAAREVFPQARRVVDRFHVAQAYREGVETLRKAELKRLKAVLPDAQFAEIKKVCWPLRKRLHDLDPEKDAALFKLFELSPALHQAYILRESLTWVFDLAYSKAQGRQALLRWCDQVRASGLSCFDAFLGTVDKWLDEITNYFIHGDTSGFVEGLNNKIKVIKRRCYGILNLDHLFQRLHLDLHGYRLFGLA